jgi:hypothetical protein
LNLCKKSKQFSAEKRRRHRDSPKKSFSATLGDFGEVRRTKLFCLVAACPRWVVDEEERK